MVAEQLTDDQIADMVRAEWDQRPNEIVGRINRRVDHAIRAVAKQLDMDWRPVLKAYRAKYPRATSLVDMTITKRPLS